MARHVDEDLVWLVLGTTITLLVGVTVAYLAAVSRSTAPRAGLRQQGPPHGQHAPYVRQQERIAVDVSGHVTNSRPQPGPPDRPYVPSRATPDFHQVGFVTDTAKGLRIPLYGRPAPRNPSRWQYYVAENSDVRIGVRSNGVCMADIGCPELDSGADVQVPELGNGNMKATVYDRLY